MAPFKTIAPRSAVALMSWLLVIALCACGGGADIALSAVAAEAPQAASGQTVTVDANRSFSPSRLVPKIAFACARDSLTCVEVASTGDTLQTNVPLTFGLPLKAGAWKHQGSALYATDDMGRSISVQADDISSHRDGTAGFAVISALLPSLQPGERRIISFFAGGNRAAAQSLTEVSDWTLEVVATIYSPHTVKVTFGDRSGQKPGTPFNEGETIGITLTSSNGGSENYKLTVTSNQAGGGYLTLQSIASAFATLINQKSQFFAADKPLKSYENFFIRTKDPANGAFGIALEYSGLASLKSSTVAAFSQPEIWSYAPQRDLAKAIKFDGTSKINKGSIRFTGPVASEFHVAAPLVNQATGKSHPFLTARLDVRFYEQGRRSRTDVALENNWTFREDPHNITYELDVKQKGKTIFHQPVFQHFHHARWHKALWSEDPKYVLRHQIQDFFDSKAVHNYDLSLPITEAILRAEQTNLENVKQTQAHLGPMASLLLRPDFLSTGGRAENGPLPRWTTLYLLTQDERAFNSMMDNSNAIAGVPIHYRDEATDMPLDPLEHSSYSTHFNSRKKPPGSSDPTIWGPDQAHQASFTYVPYLLTGDRFYMEEMMFWASWNVLNQTVANRQGALALVTKDQIRAQAWSMRSFGEIYRSLPDQHPMKLVYANILQNNLNRLYEIYVTQKLASPLGAITHLNSTATSPWQMDYFVTTMSLLAQNRAPHAQEILNWWGNFSVGRFLSDDLGFCAARAPGNYLRISQGDGKYLTTLKQVFDVNYPNDIGKKCGDLEINEGYPNSHTGYVAYARGALGAAANAGVPRAAEAYKKWKSMTPLLEKAFAANPSWAISPRN